MASGNLTTEQIYPQKRGILKIETTSRQVLWSVENYLPLLVSQKTICSDTFRVPTLTNSLFYLYLSICGGLISLNIIKTLKKHSLSTIIKNPIKVIITISDAENRIGLTKEFVLSNDGNITLPLQFEAGNMHSHEFVNKACLEVQCTIINSETEHLPLFKTIHEFPDSKAYVPTISSSELKEHLQVILEGEVHNHVTICVDGEQFQVHKSILCSHSPVFTAMFEHDTLEKSKSQICIKDISSDTLKEIISFLYFGSTSKMSPELAMNLYVASDKYVMTDLKRKSSHYLTKNLKKESVLDTLVLADRHADEELKNMAINFLVNEASDIIETEEFLGFIETESELSRSIILHLVKIVAK